MGYNYYIACGSCHKFVDLGRWRVIGNFQFGDASESLFPGAGNVAAVRIVANQLRESLSAMDDLHGKEPSHLALRVILNTFCSEHDGHSLYFINDSGDLPWHVCSGYTWYEWAEIISPNTNLARVDLPKNLVHDLNLQSWADIERHLLKSHRYDPANFPGDIELVKQGFEKLFQNNIIPQPSAEPDRQEHYIMKKNEFAVFLLLISVLLAGCASA